jgi:hypothetical protein
LKSNIFPEDSKLEATEESRVASRQVNQNEKQSSKKRKVYGIAGVKKVCGEINERFFVGHSLRAK